MPPDFSRDVHCLLGLPFDAVDLSEAESKVRRAAQYREPCFFSTPNLNFLIACQADQVFRNSVLNSDLSVADGTPVVWLSKLLGLPIRQRVAGSDLFERLRASTAKPLRVFFFGGPEGVAEVACRRLNEGQSGLWCVGFESPGFGSIADMSSDAAIASINDSQADFVVVSLGAKKGQAWIEHNRARLNAPVLSHLGAVVNFVAGTVSRAPLFFQRFGLEWLWRIKEEPALWRRYWGDGTSLLRLLATRVLPALLFRFATAPSRDQLANASVSINTTPELTRLVLTGAWSRHNLQPVREAYREAALAGKSVRIDMAGVPHVDGAFLGVTMLLFAYLGEKGLTLGISSLSNPVRRTFKYSCAEYLCTGVT